MEGLSARELYELAKKREREEDERARRSEAMAQVRKLEKKRLELENKHDTAITILENQISDLQLRRKQLIAEHEDALAAIDREIGEQVSRAAMQAAKSEAPDYSVNVVKPAKKEATPEPAAPAEKPATLERPPAAKPTPPAETPAEKPAAKPAPGKKPSPAEELAELADFLRTTFKYRKTISYSLLKETLKAKRFNTATLGRQLDQLCREGKLLKQGNENFSPGRKL